MGRLHVDLTWIVKNEYIRKHEQDKGPRIFLADGVSFGREKHAKHQVLFVGKDRQEIMTRAFLPNILQTSGNIVVFEAGHRMYDTCAETLKKKGYLVKYFAPANPDASSKYNPLADMKNTDEETEEEALSTFCRMLYDDLNIYFGSNDGFLRKAMIAFLKAVISYCIEFQSDRRTSMEGVYSLMTEGIDGLNVRMNSVQGSAAANHWAMFMLASEPMKRSIFNCSAVILNDLNKDYGNIINAKKYENPIRSDDVWGKKTALFIDTRTANNTEWFLIKYLWTQIDAIGKKITNGKKWNETTPMSVFVDDIQDKKYEPMFSKNPSQFLYISYLFACDSFLENIPKQANYDDYLVFFDSNWNDEEKAFFGHFHMGCTESGIKLKPDKCVVVSDKRGGGFMAKKMKAVSLAPVKDIRNPPNSAECSWND